MDIKIFENNKGGRKIAYNGFTYTKGKKLKSGRIYWRCAKRNNHCKGTITTSSEISDPIIGNVHNHDACSKEVFFKEILI